MPGVNSRMTSRHAASDASHSSSNSPSMRSTGMSTSPATRARADLLQDGGFLQLDERHGIVGLVCLLESQAAVGARRTEHDRVALRNGKVDEPLQRQRR